MPIIPIFVSHSLFHYFREFFLSLDDVSCTALIDTRVLSDSGAIFFPSKVHVECRYAFRVPIYRVSTFLGFVKITGIFAALGSTSDCTAHFWNRNAENISKFVGIVQKYSRKNGFFNLRKPLSKKRIFRSVPSFGGSANVRARVIRFYSSKKGENS